MLAGGKPDPIGGVVGCLRPLALANHVDVTCQANVLQSVTWKDLTSYVKLVVLIWKILRVTVWDMGGVRTAVTCYVKLFRLTE